MGVRPPVGFGECSEPLEEAVEDADGDTLDGKTGGATPPEPFIENGDLRLAELDEAEEVASSTPGALVGGMTPPRPPRVLWYVSNRDMSPEPRCGAP